jgi:hypothetical protein
MSSIFSDPFFRRGTTLLGGETIELDPSGNPVAGNEVVGQVKVFRDVNPYTGIVNSNRLVYCVAARYKGTTVTDGSTVAGELYTFSATKPLTEFENKTAIADTDVGLAFGVLDEYLTGQLRQNDIVWLVVKGPTSAKQTAAAINAGVAVKSGTGGTAGSILAQGGSGTVIGQQIGGANTAASVGLTRINLHSKQI